jgi:hypothetical protein
MANKIIFMVVGIGLQVPGNRGTVCTTWPDCDRGFPGSAEGIASSYDNTGYVNIKGHSTFTAMGGTVFDHEYEALGWLDHAPAGQRFKATYLHALIIRSTM